MRTNVIVFFLALMLTGCSYVGEPLRECPYSEDMTLSFRLLTSDPLIGSRADDMNHDETGSEIRNIEDGIDIRDLGLFIFAKAANSTGDEKLVLKLIDIAASTNPEMMITGSPGAYTVTMVMDREKFNDIVGLDVNPSGTENITFRVLILANSSSPGTSGLGKWNQINGSTFTEVINQLSQWGYAMNYLYNKNTVSEEAVQIYSNQKKHIPMFGTNVFTVTQEALYYSRQDQRVFLGEIDLLRSMAKVRVVDNIKNKDANGYPKIVSAEFIGSQDMLRQLPLDAADYVNGNQVHNPNIYSPDVELKTDGAPVYRLGTIPGQWDMTPAVNRTGITRIGYVPEQLIANINGDVQQGMPMFRVKVALQQNNDGTEDTKTYDVPMTGYKTQTFDFGDNILRNHIYTLSVDEINLGAEARLTMTVKDWTPVEQTLDYTETVTVSPALEWLPSSYQSIDADAGIIEVKPWSSEPIPVVGEFGLQTPIGATWTAYLISTEGEQNAFCFFENGIESNTVSGVIDGSSHFSLSIISTIVAPTRLSSAMLQVVVTLGNGTILEVPLAPEGTSFKNYTIIQNRQ